MTSMRRTIIASLAALLGACSGADPDGGGAAMSFVAVSAGSGFTCGLNTDSAAWCWGANQYGQLAAPSSAEVCKVDPVATGSCRARPAAVAGDLKFTAIDAGESHVCALAGDGQAFCWGDNSSGQLGNVDSSETCTVTYYEQRGYGPTLCSRVPRAVESPLRFTSITAASGFTCALTREGAAHCWGHWTNRRMGGAGSPIGNGLPTHIEAPEAFTQIAADGGRACALTAAGRVYCWGRALSPSPIATAVSFTALSRGWRHTCGIARDSTAHCWGENESGQLGNGEVNPRFDSGDTTVHAVAGNVKFREIDAGFLSTCAIATDGTQYCWGDGSVIGVAATDRCTHAEASSACALRPVRTTLTDVVGMTSGFTHRCALRAGGEASCWGNNESRAVSPDTVRRVFAPKVVSVNDR